MGILAFILDLDQLSSSTSVFAADPQFITTVAGIPVFIGPTKTMSTNVIYFGNDNLVQLIALFDESSGIFVTNATVSFNIIDNTDTILASGSMPSQGGGSNYSGTLTALQVSALTVGTGYRCQINVITQAAQAAQWAVPIIVKLREN